MKKIMTTRYNMTNDCGDSADRLIIYAVESDEEYFQLCDQIEQEGTDSVIHDLGYFSDDSCEPIPGMKYYNYSGNLIGTFFVVNETAQMDI